MSTKVGSVRKALIVAAGIALVCSARAYDSSSYEQDGLIAQWDGIDNAGDGVGHNAEATQWIDLKHGYAFDLKNVTIGETYMSFSGGTGSYGVMTAEESALAFPSGAKTVEVVCQFTKTGVQVVLHGPTASGIAFGDGDGTYYYLHNTTKSLHPWISSRNVPHAFSWSYSASNAFENFFLADGEYANLDDKTSWEYGRIQGSTDQAFIGKSAENKSAFQGRIHAIRIYNRLLTADEAKKHARIDLQRFNGVPDLAFPEVAMQYYDGVNPCHPTVGKIVDRETDTELQSSDYDISYGSNDAPGAGTWIFTGKGNYAGYTATRTFAIRRAPSTLRTCEWINGNTSAAQDWKVTTNWKDLDDDGVGDVPRPGDNVLVAAAANINFAGAEIGTLTHTNGALTITCNGGTMTNDENFVTKGASVKLSKMTFWMTEGEHVISNTCTITVGDNTTYFKGPGGFTKMGKGTFSYDSGAETLYFWKGPLKILEGTFSTTHYAGSGGIEKPMFDGSFEYIVSGPVAVLTLRAVGQLPRGALLSVSNGGKVSISAAQSVAQMTIDGNACARGSWGSWSSSASYKSFCIVGSPINVLGSGGTWEGIGNVYWTGETKHWNGKTSESYETASNWDEGLVPNDLDDVVINAGVTRTMKFKNGANYYWHSFTNLSTATLSGNAKVYGDFVLRGGNMAASNQIYFKGKWDHVLDTGSGTLTMSWHTNLKEGTIAGEGRLIKRGSGKVINNTNHSAPFGLNGTLVVEEGHMDLTGNHQMWYESMICTNIVVKGTGSKLTLTQAKMHESATVNVLNGGVVNLNGSFTNTIDRLYLDDSAMIKGRTYGSKNSDAKRRIAYPFFSGKGAVLPTDGPNPPGMLLFVR